MFKHLLSVIAVALVIAIVIPVTLHSAPPADHHKPVIIFQKEKPLAALFFKIRAMAIAFPFCPDFIRWGSQKRAKIYGGESSDMKHVPNYRKPIPIPPEK